MPQTKKMSQQEQEEMEKALESGTTSTTSTTSLGTVGGVKIQPVQSSSSYVNVLIYGESGVGKTVLSGSSSVIEEMSPTLYLDIEGGGMSLLDFYPNVETAPIKKWAELQAIYDELYRGKSKYKTVIIDSLTEAQKLAMRDHMAVSANRDASIDEDVPQMQHWLKNIEQMRRFVRAMRDLPMNVVFTALEAQEKDNRGRWQTRPSMNGKLQQELPGFFDLVLYMYNKTEKVDKQVVTKRMLLTKRTDTVQAKDRSNKLPQVIEEPTMEDVYNIITGKATHATSNGDSK